MTEPATVANRYARAVVAGKTPACKWVKLACARHLADLERAKRRDPAFPYRFDRKRAGRVCRFVELLPHIKGEWAKRGETLRLEPWQTFILASAFGWLRTGDGLRRFRTVYLEIPRKNAKSTLSSALSLYMLALDGEAGADCYSAATKREQAKIVFGDARLMAMRAAEFRLRYGVEVFANSIVMPATGSRLTPLDAEAKTQDGLNVHFVCNDELHAHRTRALYDVLETATGARAQPLIWNITTAGSDRSGICYELRDYLTKILDGVFVDETVFGMIYTLDDGDDWLDPAAWAKANPNLGVSVMPDDMQRLADKARQQPSARNPFLTKRLNVWVNADQAWMDMRAWAACADPRLALDQFAGEACWIGLDFAQRTDVAAKVLVFRRGDDVYAFGHYYVPEARLADGSNDQYAGWATQGWLTATPGEVIDLDYLERDIMGDDRPGAAGDIARFTVREIAFDPWQASLIVPHLQATGVPCVEVRPTVANFSEPMKELEALVLQGRFHHPADPVLTWMIANVVCHHDARDNIYPRKERPQNKIDGAVALIMALGRAGVAAAPAQPSLADPAMMTACFG
ncbi:MAG: terminase large subunit [Rhodospirillales bacterium]|nr:terminase large subunit [Rhodospirillales bacterium]